MHIKALLTQQIEAAFAELGMQGPAVIQAASRAEFGDYQANGVMAAAKRAGLNPRDVAADVIARLNSDANFSAMVSAMEVAGPGFINITLAASFVAPSLATTIDACSTPQTVVVDYSAPNLAKEMHVGHLRTTIIGDSVVRVLEALGHHVIRQNHVGDWGTQFGMLLTYLEDSGNASDKLADLENFYRASKQRFDKDEDFRERSRRAVVALQSGDAAALQQWQRFIDISMSHCQDIYDRLGITLSADNIMGESAYNDDLAGVIDALDGAGLLQQSEGADCVFLDQFKNKQGDIQPVIVRKSDGGYLYATTDLAAISHRAKRLQADRVLYFVDARQSLHFKQIFAVARAAGFAPEALQLEHLPFGTMLGQDGKPFKTRQGGIIKLADLLDEAERRAAALVREKNPNIEPEQLAHLAKVIGLGAVKYSDLSKNRTSDYVFDWDQMLSFDGNTAPYLQYAYSRIQSVLRKAGVDPAQLPREAIAEEEPERRLAVYIAAFNDVLQQVADEGYPHYLCAYLYELATRFTTFYEQCPILNSDDAQRTRRLVLANSTGIALQKGLDLLGIDVVDQM
ncbi:MAG: arginine--tRNA ligase [Gammaproteobacteria bacterium]|jgi:arginyl-tRNA synthetase|nr:arginine--tRNA ligase [Gammaproteobacteria bacterium]